ncbi:MAG: iron ABC transporter permease [Clostridia bacterium]|nr:iron ABC transporter permease [Clostridia bacterium]
MKNNQATIRKAGGVALLLLLLLCGFFALRLGSAEMDLPAFWAGLTGQSATERIILYHLRLPRILGAVLAGIGLSVAGLLLQTVTGNDLAGPNIIGVNAGAGLGAILTLFFAPELVLLLPVTAFAGAFLTALLIVAIAARIDTSKATVILAGVAVTALLNAGISLISLLDTDVLASYNHFSIGGLAGIALKQLPLPALLILCCFALALLFAKRIEVLTLGDSIAASLGLRVRPIRIFCLILASASAAAAVSFAGLLGFVGLVVPHMARRMARGLRQQLLYAALLGSILVLLADLLGRILTAPSELPVGILLAAIGAPFFFYLLIRRKKP